MQLKLLALGRRLGRLAGVRRARPRSASRALGGLRALSIASLWLFGGTSAAQVVEADIAAQVFHEPSKSSKMTVYTPEVSLSAKPHGGLRVAASYKADIVTGASEAVKAGPLLADRPDIVSRASVRDHRHIASGSAALEQRHSRLSVGYAYGTENDYRSNAISVTAGTDFLQRNTDVEIGYSHGFDEVCTLAQRNLPATLRRGLESSKRCFTADESVEALPISLDNFRVAWTQAWSPVFTTQLVATFAIQHGFLGNPYRQVVLGPTGQSAQENHPEERRRAAIGLRGKYYSRLLETAIGLSARGYRDSWEVSSATAELTAERYLAEGIRLEAHGRAYVQSAASFWSDDYTGGEPRWGPRGQYWSGDRELSPLRTLLVGLRVHAQWQGTAAQPVAGLFETFSLGLTADLLQTQLSDFTWAGELPDDTVVLLPSLSLTGGL